MTHNIPFLKVSGAGNDFILVDNLKETLSPDWVQFSRVACPRISGVGVDGLLLLEPSPKSSFLMRYFNADGSYGGMCGNGGRCAARYAHEHGISEARLTFEASGHIYHANVDGSTVTITMKDVPGEKEGISLDLEGYDRFDLTAMDTGSPQVIIWVPNLEDVNVEQVGRLIRNHQAFQPDGVNVNFLARGTEDQLQLRTYERGVERETMACGTGAVASALTAARTHGLESPVSLQVRSGETLSVGFQQSGDLFSRVTLTGSARFLFGGIVRYDESEQTIQEPVINLTRNPA